MSLRAYQQASQRAESPREVEYRLFGEVTRSLMAAAELPDRTHRPRPDALLLLLVTQVVAPRRGEDRAVAQRADGRLELDAVQHDVQAPLGGELLAPLRHEGDHIGRGFQQCSEPFVALAQLLFNFPAQRPRFCVLQRPLDRP